MLLLILVLKNARKFTIKKSLWRVTSNFVLSLQLSVSLKFFQNKKFIFKKRPQGIYVVDTGSHSNYCLLSLSFHKLCWSQPLSSEWQQVHSASSLLSHLLSAAGFYFHMGSGFNFSFVGPYTVSWEELTLRGCYGLNVVFPLPRKFICWNPSSQVGGIGRWGL